MMQQTLEEWQAEMKASFKSSNDVMFVCPACGRISTVKEHVTAGGQPDDAPQQCIGRTTRLGTKNQKDVGYGCNWAAFGLFGTLGKGRKIVMPNGREAEVFDFAKPEVVADAQKQTAM